MHRSRLLGVQATELHPFGPLCNDGEGETIHTQVDLWCGSDGDGKDEGNEAAGAEGSGVGSRSQVQEMVNA